MFGKTGNIEAELIELLEASIVEREKDACKA